MDTTSVRIDATTHQELKKPAAALDTTLGATVALAVRRLRQERMGVELSRELADEEVSWLNAGLE